MGLFFNFKFVTKIISKIPKPFVSPHHFTLIPSDSGMPPARRSYLGDLQIKIPAPRPHRYLFPHRVIHGDGKVMRNKNSTREGVGSQMPGE